MNFAHAHVALFLSGLAGGGAQRRMLTLAREFAARGHRVDVVVASSEGPFRKQLSPAVRLVSLDATPARLPGLSTARGPKVLASTLALAAYMRRERPDVVLSTSNPANLATLWARSLARTRTPVVISINVHLGEATGTRQKAWGPLLRSLLRRFYPSADAIIAISDGVATDLARRTGVATERITTIYNPIDLEAVQAQAREPLDHPWAAGAGAPLLLAVGKLKIQKDFATLIRAFARVRRQRPARLVILGEGEERAHLERLARDLGVAADVLMPGFTDNPYAWMARASVFVLSSAWEGFSNALCEALACGCPVVSTDCPSGPAEVLEGGNYGPLVPVGDECALADAIVAVIDNPPPAPRQCARAADFSLEAAADRYLDVLLRVRRTAGEEERGGEAKPMDEHRRHIAIFIYALTGGGAQRRTLTLVNAFAERGHRVDLVVVRAEALLTRALSPEVRLIALESGWGRLLPFVCRHTGQRGLQTAASTWALARYLRQQRPDVMMSAASHVNLVSVLARRLVRPRVPLVLRASNHPSGNSKLWPTAERPVRLFLKWVASRVYPWADRVIAVSEGVAREIADLTGLGPERITTIYNPTLTPDLQKRADAPVDHPWLAADAPPVVLGAGKLKVQKDFRTLIEAFARVRRDRLARLVILGDGGQRASLEALAQKLGVAEDVALVGHVDNPLAWMKAASVFVLSSAWEGLPGVLIEAMACGCPVVSTDCPSGPAEILDGGKYGPLVPVADDRALADAILSVLDEPTDAQVLRDRVAMFAVDPAVDRYLEVLLEHARTNEHVITPAPPSSVVRPTAPGHAR